MADCAALEMLCTARYRGFESRPLRHFRLDNREYSKLRERIPWHVTKTVPQPYPEVAGARIGSVEDGALLARN